ncbi:uncharacterized protein [Aegilops tauschii subsp. strangulata]|uniref:uncharacterized protein n=1 Tax=Aegilops tauschii subsp. strangulata TaxID=200361 RepID=UPI003CC854DA
MPPGRRAGKAASEPQKAASEPQPAAGSSSSAQDVEVASATSGWTPGGGTTVMNVAAQDVRTRLQAQAMALRQYTDEFPATRAAIRDYHNLRAAAFNSQARELTQKTADLTESRAANAGLRAQLGESQTALRAKEAELAALVQERDRLAKRLADQEEGHKAALKAVQDREAALQAEYETEAAGWAEARQTLINGYGQIKDLVDEYFTGYSTAANQIIEARRQARSPAGFEIARSASRSLEEQLLPIQARLQPAHRLLRRLQRAGAQVLAALWPGEVVPRTPVGLPTGWRWR